MRWARLKPLPLKIESAYWRQHVRIVGFLPVLKNKLQTALAVEFIHLQALHRFDLGGHGKSLFFPHVL